MNFLFRRSDSRHLALIRILLGVWFFVDLFSMMVSGYVKTAYVTATMNFPFYGFEWIKPLPGPWMYVLFIVLIVSTIGIVIGFHIRTNLLIFLIGFGYVFMCDIVYTLNKFYLFLVLVFVLLIVGEKHTVKKRKIVTQVDSMPYWKIAVFQGLLIMIYFYSGISKINPDWLLRAAPLRYFLRPDFFFLSDETFLYVAFAFTYCGFIFDLSISCLLLNKKTRLFGHVLQTSFHSMNFIFLGIGSLSLFMIALTWLLFPTDGLRRKLKLKALEKEVIQVPERRKRWILAGLYLFFAINLLVPHRHYLTGNNVNWTEKGHRFSWRLMTRTKRGSQSTFFVDSDQLEKADRINPRKLLTSRQYRKMSGETDLVLVFAHYLRDKYREEGHTNVIVKGKILTRMNGRDAEYLVDPDLDLASAERSVIKDRVSTRINVAF